MTNPASEAYLRGIMPGLSDRQYELRAKLIMARHAAGDAMARGEMPLHQWQQYYFIGDIVNLTLHKTMDDAALSKVVDYCRTLMRAALDAGEIFDAIG